MSLSTCFFPEEISQPQRFTKKRTNFDIFLSSVERTVNYVDKTSNPVFSGNNSSTSSLSTRSRSATSSTVSSTPTSPILECTYTEPQFGSKSCPAATQEVAWHHQLDSQGSVILRREEKPVPCFKPPMSLSSPTTETLSSASPEYRPRQNCYQFNKAPGSSVHNNTCFFISAQGHRPSSSSARSSLIPCTETITLPIPSSPVRSRELCKLIWNSFEAMKAENDAIRKWISGSSSPRSPQKRQNPNINQKISLRAEAPLVWLKWRAADGLRKGQTRSERNWEDIWHRILLEQDSPPSETETLSDSTAHFGWVTISFPPEHLRDLLKAVEKDDRLLRG